MDLYRAAICLALLSAFLAGCSPFSRFRSGAAVQVGTVAGDDALLLDAVPKTAEAETPVAETPSTETAVAATASAEAETAEAASPEAEAPRVLAAIDTAAAPAVQAAPAFASFEATELATGLGCTGGYIPLEKSATFTADVVCEDGRTGKVTAARPGDLGGTGTLVFAGGARAAVSLRQASATGGEAPPAAINQLPAPELSAYVR